MGKKTAILLATYNGDKYLRQQIDSLYSQSRRDWTLYAHDDGSTDNTPAILNDYAAKHGNIVILEYPVQHGAKNNFLSLIEAVDADYYFLCDQDDKWCNDKVEKEMARMEEAELTHPDSPVIVFTDAYVADGDLNVTNESLWRMSGRYPEFLTTFAEGGVIDFATGCTILFNKKAKESIVRPANKATMHDSWLTLCVLRANGIVCPVSEPLLYYRQHSDNTLGAGLWDTGKWGYKLDEIAHLISKNYNRWQMLKALGYGSLLKYIRYRYLYKQRRRAAYKNEQISKNK